MTPDDEQFEACAHAEALRHGYDSSSHEKHKAFEAGARWGRDFGRREQIALEATAAVNAMNMELQKARAGLAQAVRNCDAFEDQRDAALAEVERLKRANEMLLLGADAVAEELTALRFENQKNVTINDGLLNDNEALREENEKLKHDLGNEQMRVTLRTHLLEKCEVKCKRLEEQLAYFTTENLKGSE